MSTVICPILLKWPISTKIPNNELILNETPPIGIRFAAMDRKHKRNTHSDKTKKAISDFLLRNDNSKMCPGKKDTITCLNDEKQKRHLSDTMLNLTKSSCLKTH